MVLTLKSIVVQSAEINIVVILVLTLFMSFPPYRITTNRGIIYCHYASVQLTYSGTYCDIRSTICTAT